MKIIKKVKTVPHPNLVESFYNLIATVVKVKRVNDYKRLPPNNNHTKVGSHIEYYCIFSDNDYRTKKLSTKGLWLSEEFFISCFS